MTTIEMKVRNMYSGLSKSEQIAANYFLQHKEHIFSYPLATLAQMSGTSQGAWVRFCKNIGYDGLKGLKNSLYLETSQASNADESSAQVQFADIRECTSIPATAEHVCASSIQAIETTLQLLDEQIVEKVVDLLIHASSIRFFGIGASGLVAEDLYSKFLRLGYHAFYTQDLHVCYSFAANSTPSDAAVIFSNSGETGEILRIADSLKSTGAPTVAVTQYNSSNSLARKADYVLYTNSTEIMKRSGATSSRIAQLCLADILFMTVAGRDYENVEEKLERSYASCHPALSKTKDAAP